MTMDELREEIGIELEMIGEVVRELSSLRADIGAREPTVREKTAAAAFMAQFYGGVENILKRISRFHAVPLPMGDTWHIDLFRRFCKPSHEPLPLLFEGPFADMMATYRKFRHVVHHGYGSQLDWGRMREGMSTIEDSFHMFRVALDKYLQTLGK